MNNKQDLNIENKIFLKFIFIIQQEEIRDSLLYLELRAIKQRLLIKIIDKLGINEEIDRTEHRTELRNVEIFR